MDGRGEVCLAGEVERLRRSGLGIYEMARHMGVDVVWVETVVVEDEEKLDDASEEGRTARTFPDQGGVAQRAEKEARSDPAPHAPLVD